MSERKGFTYFWRAEGEVAHQTLKAGLALFRNIYYEIRIYCKQRIIHNKIQRRNDKKNNAAHDTAIGSNNN